MYCAVIQVIHLHGMHTLKADRGPCNTPEARRVLSVCCGCPPLGCVQGVTSMNSLCCQELDLRSGPTSGLASQHLRAERCVELFFKLVVSVILALCHRPEQKKSFGMSDRSPNRPQGDQPSNCRCEAHTLTSPL